MKHSNNTLIPTTKFSQCLDMYRKEKEMNITEFVEYINISKNHLYKLYKGETENIPLVSLMILDRDDVNIWNWL